MKHVSPSHEVSLAAVRELSEGAVSRPWCRQLRCLPWSLRDRHRLVPVYQPWNQRDGGSNYQGGNDHELQQAAQENLWTERTWINPTL